MPQMDPRRLRQELHEVKSYAIRNGMILDINLDTQYRNQDSTPHWSNWSEGGHSHYTYHITIDFRYDDKNGQRWQRTAHLDVDKDATEFVGTHWFDAMEI